MVLVSEPLNAGPEVWKLSHSPIPVHMIKQGAPRKIRTAEELAVYSDTLFKLTAKECPACNSG